MTNHPNRARNTGPWRMLTWSNGDGTGETIERRYPARAAAVRAANKLRAHHIVALVEHDSEKPPITHWRY